ncbi:MAG: NYN domain-containing protein [Pseudomonadota bacterium]
MDLTEDERIALFIDGPNLFSTAKALEFGIDYGQLLALFRKRCRLVRALYYTPIIEGDGPSAVKPLLDWLDYNGYTIVAKPVRSVVNQDDQRREYSRMHVEFTIDALKLAPSLDHIVIFSGDREYTALVNELRQMGRRVSVVSTLETQPSMVADDLRRAADQFIDLADLEPMIAREMVEAKVTT